MAGNLSTYLANKLLAHSVGQASFTMPTTTYLGLFIVAPTATTAGTELVVQNGYARRPVTWGPPSSESIANLTDTRFPASSTATGPWTSVVGGSSPQNIVAVGLFDALSAGNLLWFGPLGSAIIIGNGDDLKLASGTLTLSLT